MFRSLAGVNYRIWAGGAIVSNVGTWMQRTAQDWIVLTQLTHNNASAVGFVMALQFAPQLLLLPVTGWAADHLDRRKLLMATQAAMGALGLGLGILTVTGAVQLWQVYLFALLLGVVAAFDAPARQTFVSELVAGPNLSNAVALNSASFNAARLIGPAVAGLLDGRGRRRLGVPHQRGDLRGGAAVARLCSGASSCTARSARRSRAAAWSTASATCGSARTSWSSSSWCSSSERSASTSRSSSRPCR